jgi:hypothetical protein
MFSFFIRNWKKIETAIKVLAFIATVILEAIRTISTYAERETIAVQ